MCPYIIHMSIYHSYDRTFVIRMKYVIHMYIRHTHDIHTLYIWDIHAWYIWHTWYTCLYIIHMTLHSSYVWNTSYIRIYVIRMTYIRHTYEIYSVIHMTYGVHMSIHHSYDRTFFIRMKYVIYTYIRHTHEIHTSYIWKFHVSYIWHTAYICLYIIHMTVRSSYVWNTSYACTYVIRRTYTRHTYEKLMCHTYDIRLTYPLVEAILLCSVSSYICTRVFPPTYVWRMYKVCMTCVYCFLTNTSVLSYALIYCSAVAMLLCSVPSYICTTVFPLT